jgi:hypothetical protein
VLAKVVEQLPYPVIRVNLLALAMPRGIRVAEEKIGLAVRVSSVPSP